MPPRAQWRNEEFIFFPRERNEHRSHALAGGKAIYLLHNIENKLGPNKFF